MTEGLRVLLQHFGMLCISVKHLLDERPGSSYKSLEDYYKHLGPPLPDEPVLLVRISKDGETRFLEESEHNSSLVDESGSKTGIITIWELPEDEFWFFQPFRSAISDLQKDLPPFIYEMSIVNAYAVFEDYLSGLLRARFRQHPRLMGGQREIKYDQIFDAASMDDLIDRIIEREVKELMYLPLLGLMNTMRDKLGFRSLTEEYDEEACRWALVRNCLLHKHGKVDRKLAQADPALKENEKILLAVQDMEMAISTLRKLSYEIDKVFEEKR